MSSNPVTMEQSSPVLISVLVPSRGRAVSCFQMAASLFGTADDPSQVELLIYIDDDDPQKEHYMSLLEASNSAELHAIEINCGPSEGVGVAWNYLAGECTGQLLMMGNDDLRWETQGWDTAIAEAYRAADSELFVMHCNDTIQHARHAAFPIISRSWYEIAGQFVPEIFGFGYHDTWLTQIAEILDCFIYLEHVVIRHKHYSQAGGIRDQTSQRNMHHWHRDEQIFNTHRPTREAIAVNLKAALG